MILSTSIDGKLLEALLKHSFLTRMAHARVMREALAQYLKVPAPAPKQLGRPKRIRA